MEELMMSPFLLHQRERKQVPSNGWLPREGEVLS